MEVKGGGTLSCGSRHGPFLRGLLAVFGLGSQSGSSERTSPIVEGRLMSVYYSFSAKWGFGVSFDGGLRRTG